MAIRYSVKAAPVYARTSPSALYGSSVTPPPQAPLATTGVALGTAARPAPGYGSGLGKAFSGIGQALGAGVTRAGGAINGRPLVRTQATPDPFAALSDDEQQKRAQATIDALINPRLAEIRAEYDRRSAQGSAAIRGITEALAQRLAAFGGSARDIYSQAQQSTAATEAALAGYLSGQGGAQAAGLASQLAGINAPAATGAATAAVQQAGTGAAGASYGKGAASLEQLAAQSAAAQEYAAKLPGIGAALGLQQMGKFQGQLTEDEKTVLGALTSQVPGLVSSTLSDMRSTELSKAQERRREYEYNQSRADRLAAAKQDRADRLAAAKAKAAVTGQKIIGDSKTGYFQQNAKGQWVRVVDPAPTAAAAARPFTIRPGDTVEVPDGKGGYKAYTAPAAPKPAQVVRPLSTPIGIFQYDGKNWVKIPGSEPPVKPGPAPKPFTIRPGDTVEIPDGKGGYTAYTAPPAPTAAKPPKPYNTPGGTIYWDDATKTWSTVPGTTPPAKQPSTADAKALLEAAGALNGYDPKTRTIGEGYRQALINYLSAVAGQPVDPASVPKQLTPKMVKDFVEKGWLPKTAAPGGGGTGKQPGYKERGQVAKWNATAEGFASIMYNGGTGPDFLGDPSKAKKYDPQTYTQALELAKRYGEVPAEILKKHLRDYYKHGNKAVHDFVTDPATSFVIDRQGRVAAYRNGKFVKFMQPGKPGYTYARTRAGKEAKGGGDFTIDDILNPRSAA